MKRFFGYFLLICASFFVFSTPLFASDEGLYDQPAPEDAAFVRFMNIEDVEKRVLGGPKSYKAEASQTTPYFIFTEGDYNLSVSGDETLVSVEAKNFYSVIIDNDLTLIKDQTSDNRAKAVIALYNVSEQNSSVSLKAKEGAIDILNDIHFKAMKAREINDAKIDLAVYAGDEKKAALKEVIIERNNHYSVIYDGENAHLVKADIDLSR